MRPFIRGLVALVAIAAAARAGAAERTSIVVVPFAPLFDEARASVGERISTRLEEELARSSKLSAVALPTDASETARSEKALGDAGRAFAAASELVDASHDAWADPKDEEAAGALERTITQLRSHALGAGDLTPLARALVAKARRELAKGNAGAARAAFREAAAIAPAFEPALTGEARKLQAEVLADVLAGARGSLRVESTPAGASVTFDGRAVGETPILLVDVLPGEHHVRLEKAGLVAGRTVSVAAEAEVASRFAFDALLAPGVTAISRALRANVIDDATLGAVREVGRGAGAELVVVGAIEKRRSGFAAHARVVRVSDGTIATLAPVTFDEELVGLGTDVYSLADGIEKALPSFTRPNRMPLVVAAGLAPSGGEHAQVAAITPARSAGEAEARQAAAEEQRTAGPVASALATEDAVREGAPATKSRAWLWGTLGAVTAAAVGTGLYFALAPEPADRVSMTLTW